MLNKKFLVIVVSTVTFVSLMMLVSNFTYAEEETHKHSEKLLSPEQPNVESPLCPYCKEVRLSPRRGRVPAAKHMVCPNCKNEISELAVHRYPLAY